MPTGVIRDFPGPMPAGLGFEKLPPAPVCAQLWLPALSFVVLVGCGQQPEFLSVAQMEEVNLNTVSDLQKSCSGLAQCLQLCLGPGAHPGLLASLPFGVHFY